MFSGELKLVSGKKFNLVGTPEGDEIKDISRMLQPAFAHCAISSANFINLQNSSFFRMLLTILISTYLMTRKQRQCTHEIKETSAKLKKLLPH
jgi:hypothetical protein